MKKILSITFALLILAPFSAFATNNIDLNKNALADWKCSDTYYNTINFWDINNQEASGYFFDTCTYPGLSPWYEIMNYRTGYSDIGGKTFIVIENSGGECGTSSYATCLLNGNFLKTYTITFTSRVMKAPSNLATDMLATASDTLADPGTLLIVVSIIALGILFWIIGELTTLFPGVERKTLASMDRDLEKRNRKALKDLYL